MTDRKKNNLIVHFIVGLLLISSPAIYAQNLIEIYELAAQNDPTIKQSEAKRQAAGEAKAQSLARLMPTLSASAASSKEWLYNGKAGTDFRGNLSNQDYWNHTLNANLTQPLFHFEHWIQLSQSENQIAQAEATYQTEFQNLIVKVIEAYFNILYAQDNLEFTTAEKQGIAEQLEQAKERFNVGLVPVTDFYEAQAAYDQTSANEIEAINNLDNQKEALREIIGNVAFTLSRMGNDLPLKQPEPNDIAKWDELAETSNFGIIAAFNQMEVARKTVDVQRSGHLPKLDLVASYGVSDVNSSFGFRGDTKNVGIQLNMPLFEGGAVNSRARQANYEYEAAKENLTATKRSVKRQLNNTFRSIFSAISRIQALKTAENSTASALESAQTGMEVGTRTMVDVLTEQRSVYRVKRDLSRARYDYIINMAKLKQAVGGLTQSDLENINDLLLENSHDI